MRNGGSSSLNYWRCSNRECKATIQTSKSTDNLAGQLPEHNHTNKLLKRAALDTEDKVIKKYVACQGARPTQVLAEISTNMLRSSLPGQIHCASSSSAIKMKLWRGKQALNPRPKIPSSHADLMNALIPDELKQTDGS